MKFYFTGIQHLHDGNEAVFPVLGYTSKDDYLATGTCTLEGEISIVKIK